VPTEPSLFELARVGGEMDSGAGDIRDPQALTSAISKAGPEIVIHMAAQPLVRRSFFSEPDSPRVASARAGNVIGGGDWGEDRLVPDIMRAAFAGETLRVRNPNAVRPWQHVLCPLSGYLVLAQALCESPDYATAWNFGPDEEDARTVGWIVERIAELWPGGGDLRGVTLGQIERFGCAAVVS